MVPIPNFHFGVYLIPPAETTKAVVSALELGYTGIDSARFYENERETVAGILSYLKSHPEKKREDIFYTTKIPPNEFGYEKTKKAVRDSYEIAKALGKIDLILLHASHGGPEVRKETWKALEDAQAEGLVEHIGVSNWGVKHFEQLEKSQKVKPFLNQVELSPWLQRRDIKKYSDAHGILVEAWSPLTRGKRLDDPEVVRLSKHYGKTPAQILLRWSLQYDVIPVVKSTSPERMKENLGAFDFELTKEDFDALGNPDEYYLVSSEWDPTVLP